MSRFGRFLRSIKPRQAHGWLLHQGSSGSTGLRFGVALYAIGLRGSVSFFLIAVPQSPLDLWNIERMGRPGSGKQQQRTLYRVLAYCSRTSWWGAARIAVMGTMTAAQPSTR